jgi:AcrR family transcriptional regulator
MQPSEGTAGGSPVGLRVRKKERTRKAIQAAALELFARQGYEATTVEAIATMAEVSTTTFFRYFPSKEEVIFDDRHRRRSAVRRAILEAPANEGDLQVVQAALEGAWAASTEPELVALQCRAVASASILRGRGADVAAESEATISEALGERRGLEKSDPSCRLTASVAMTVLSRTVFAWAIQGSTAPLADTIHQAFEQLMALAADWSTAGQHQGRQQGRADGT